MINLIKTNIKNNRVSFIVTLILIVISNIIIFETDIQKNLDLFNTGLYKWYELLMPLIPMYFIISANSDFFSKDNIEYFYTLPISIEKSLILKNIIFIIMFFILFTPGIYKINFYIVNNFGKSYLPKGGLYLYVLENLFILCSYTLFILIIFKEFYFSIGFLVIYILFDYFTGGSFLNLFTIYGFTFRKFSEEGFIFNRVLVLFIGLILYLVSYLILKKFKIYRKLI